MGIYSPQSLGIKAPTGGFQTGGWYNARQYWNGTLGEVNQIHQESNQQGAGKEVSAPVVAASNPAQNLAPGTNEAYIASEKAKQEKLNPPVVGPSGTPNFVSDTTTPTNNAGGTSAIGSAKPTIDLTSVYNTAYNTPEITASNKAVSDAQAEIDKAQAAHDAEMAIINDNPLYSAGTMTGKADKLDKKFSADLNRLQNAKAIAAGELAQKKADAEIKVNLAMKQYDINNQAYKDSLSLFNSLLDAGALINASGTDIAGYASTLGIPTSMINSIVSSQKAKAVNSQVITATDNSGNMTAVVINKDTGAVISKTSLGKIDGTKVGTATDTKQSYYNYAKSDARSGVTLQQMLQIYGGYLTPNEIYATYNSNSTHGPAKEDANMLKSYGINPGLNAADALSALLGGGGQ